MADRAKKVKTYSNSRKNEAMLFSILPAHATLFHVLPLGLLLGSVYAVSFVIQQRRLFFMPKTRTGILPLILIRILLITLTSYYLLHLPSTRHILVCTLAFIAGFWLVILSKRILPYGRT